MQRIRKQYVINGKHYFQEELKFIQFKELMDLILPFQNAFPKDPGESLDVQTLVKLFGQNFLRAVAVVLIEEGLSVRERDIERAVEDLEVESLEKIEEIVEDFFSLNDLHSHIGRITGIMGKVAEAPKPGRGKKSTGEKSSSKLQAETQGA